MRGRLLAINDMADHRRMLAMIRIYDLRRQLGQQERTDLKPSMKKHVIELIEYDKTQAYPRTIKINENLVISMCFGSGTYATLRPRKQDFEAAMKVIASLPDPYMREDLCHRYEALRDAGYVFCHRSPRTGRFTEVRPNGNCGLSKVRDLAIAGVFGQVAWDLPEIAKQRPIDRVKERLDSQEQEPAVDLPQVVSTKDSASLDFAVQAEHLAYAAVEEGIKSYQGEHHGFVVVLTEVTYDPEGLVDAGDLPALITDDHIYQRCKAVASAGGRETLAEAIWGLVGARIDPATSLFAKARKRFSEQRVPAETRLAAEHLRQGPRHKTRESIPGSAHQSEAIHWIRGR